MRLLIHSPSFHPNVGGIETVSEILGRELVKRGHGVRIYTDTQAASEDTAFPFAVVRKSTGSSLMTEVRRCDAYLQMGVSLKGLYPLLFFRRPWIISHHTWYQPSHQPLNRLKRALMSLGTNLYCSEAVALDLGKPGVVVGNAYDDSIFRVIASVPREVDLVFLGRLVSDKGVDILLNSLGILQKQQLRPTLTVIGTGPERQNLESQVAELGLEDHVRFAGELRGNELAEMLNRHQIMVIPSRWNEPFGIVALEGIACGCVPAGSQGGGLGEAIGPCGPLFANADPVALAEQLRRLLTSAPLLDAYRSHAAQHLSLYSPEALARRYESAILSAIAGSPLQPTP